MNLMITASALVLLIAVLANGVPAPPRKRPPHTTQKPAPPRPRPGHPKQDPAPPRPRPGHPKQDPAPPRPRPGHPKQEQECENTLGDSCYVIIKKPMSWYDANAECSKRGGHLVWVESKREHRFLARLAKKEIDGSVWIGLIDDFLEGNWRWPGRPKGTTYIKWTAGEPNNHKNKENCAAMWVRENYRWFDTSCMRKLRSICEKSL